jgi:hypothetical protein
MKPLGRENDIVTAGRHFIEAVDESDGVTRAEGKFRPLQSARVGLEHSQPKRGGVRELLESVRERPIANL